jgi:ABC-type transport system substrate-binding protein
MFSFAFILMIVCADTQAETLRVGVLSPPKSLNFFGATDIWSKKVLRLFHMPLYVQAPQNGEMIPWLAESLPESGAEPDQFVVKLRPALWDDGTAVTADDLAFTVDVIQRFRVPGHIEKWEMVKYVEVLDPRTVRFTLKHPSAVFLHHTLFTSFVRKKEWEPLTRSLDKEKDPLKILTEFKPERVASNGPFFLASCCEPNYIVLKKNAHFFARCLNIGGETAGPYIESVIFYVYRNDMEAIIALNQGDIDFIWSDIPQEKVDELKQNNKVRLYRTVGRGYDYLAFNLERAPFNDKAFRKAVAVLVDRGTIIKETLKGDATPAYSVVPPNNFFWHNPRVSDPGDGFTAEKRPEEARRILKGAGYSWSGDKLILPNGQEMASMEILTNSAGSKPGRVKTAILIKNRLSSLGVPVTIKMLSLHKMLALLNKNSFDAYIMGWTHLSDDPGYLSTFFHSSEARPFGKNYPRFRNPDFDALADRASSETDLSKRRELVFEMQELIADELPYIPLYARNVVEVVRSDRFSGWIEMPGGIGNLWSFLNVKAMTP